jgi:hypothetical protein
MAERPEGTYVSKVFNPGIDKGIPSGFVDVVYNRSNGKSPGFMQDGKFYATGEKPPAKIKGPDTKKEVQGKIKTLEDSIQTAEKVINDPTNPNKEFARTQLNKFKAKLEPLKQTEQDILGKEKAAKEKQIQESKKISEEGAFEAGVRLSGGRKPLPPGAIIPKMGPTAIVKTKETTATPDATPAAKTPGTTGAVTTGTTGAGGTKPAAKKKAAAASKPGKAKPANIDEIFALVQSQYGPVDAIFKEDPDLKALMIAATKGTADTADDYTPQRFLNELQTTTWWAENSGPIRQRQFYKKQYEDLLKKGGNAEELAQTTEYGRGLGETKQIIADEAVRRGAALDATDLDMLATQIYDLANETSGSIVGASVRGKIKYTPGAALGGAAGVSLAELQRTASANGLNLEKQFGSNLQGWLQKIAQGESPETYKQIIRDTAKIGLPDRVASLVDKGIDLETIYNPYRNMMAATLEVNPETIKLNDPTLRMAIGPEKEMSLYDYQRTLRKDARWQYTDNARQEVSSIAKSVLKDFGFQG